MKVLLLNGSPHANGCTRAALAEVERALQAEGVETECLHVAAKPVRGCIGCGGCAKTHRCVFGDDAVNACIGALAQADGLVVGSPVYYASPNGTVLSLLDRVFYAGSCYAAHKPAAAVVSARRGGTTAALDVLTKYFTISQMPVVSSTYWPMVHGNRPEGGGGRPGGPADHAQPGAQHGLSVALHRGGAAGRCARAGGGARQPHQFHPLKVPACARLHGGLRVSRICLSDRKHLFILHETAFGTTYGNATVCHRLRPLGLFDRVVSRPAGARRRALWARRFAAHAALSGRAPERPARIAALRAAHHVAGGRLPGGDGRRVHRRAGAARPDGRAAPAAALGPDVCTVHEGAGGGHRAAPVRNRRAGAGRSKRRGRVAGAGPRAGVFTAATRTAW